MNEENNFNENQNVQPLEPIVEPTSAPQQPVEETVVAEVTPQVEEPKKKSNKIIIVALVLVLLAGGGFAVWKFLLPTLNKENKETTTTTTTETTTAAVVSKVMSFNTMDEYLKIVSDNLDKKESEEDFIALDKNFFRFDFSLNEKCTKNGDVVAFEDNGLTFNYTCIDDFENSDFPQDQKVWKTDDAIINGKFRTKRSYNTCSQFFYYTNNKYFITVERGCGMAPAPEFSIEAENNAIIYKGIFIPFIYQDSNGRDSEKSSIVTKDNVIYFVTQEGHLENEMSTCHLKYVDLNETNPEVKDTGLTKSCLDLDI